jgi:aminoglycoside phosphotransferase (APT) family kinase protein
MARAYGTETIGTSLHALADDLAIRSPIEQLDVGFDCFVFESANGSIILVPRNATSAEGIRTAAALLPAICGRLPVKVPEPRLFLRRHEYLPFGALVYPKLAGVSLQKARLEHADWRALAGQVAKFLARLHSLHTSDLEGVRLSESGSRFHLSRVELAALEAALDREEAEKIHSWLEAVAADEALRRFEQALIHADLWYENLLVDPEALTLCGVIDWSSAALGDPAEDFAPLLYLGVPFVREVLEQYVKQTAAEPEALRRRVWRYWQARELGGVRYSLREGDGEEFADSLRKLRRGALLSPALWADWLDKQ